jgi:Tol biopolymer transport system component
VYSAKLNGTPPDTYVIRDEYPESVSAGLHGAMVLGLSKQAQVAVLVKPVYFAHTQWLGTLATSPLGGSAPRELLENVADADWSPDGSELAVIDHVANKWRVQYPVGKVLLEVDNWLSDERVSPDGQQIALFRHPPNVDDRGDLIVVDRSGKLRVLSGGWESLEGLAWAPSGKEVWFSAADSGEQYCIRAVTLAGKQRTVHCGTAPTRIHDISSSGTALVSTEESRVAMALVEHGSNEEHDLSWLDNAYGPRLSRDGSELLFTDQSGQAGHDYAVYVRKTDGSAAVRIGEGGFGTDITPDGKWAIILLPGDPAGRVQIVPVGPGQKRLLHWEGFQPLWAMWGADDEHVLLFANRSGQEGGMFLTDVNGSLPKLVSHDRIPRMGLAMDGKTYLARQNDSWSIQSMEQSGGKSSAAIQTGQRPIGWALDIQHIFAQVTGPTGLTIYKLDLNSGAQELWQTVKPKDQVGLRPMVTATAITPDGRWMAFTYSTQLGQLYRSESLK